MVTLSEPQRDAVKALGGQPVPVVDDRTNEFYYLISAEQFEKIRQALVEESFEARELYPLIAKTAAQAGWADPQMDDYDRYDESRTQG
jgi:hypothetical protein